MLAMRMRRRGLALSVSIAVLAMASAAARADNVVLSTFDPTPATTGTGFQLQSAEVGNNAYVGLYCCLGAVTLEDDVLLGSHVSVMNGGAQHGIERLDIPVREQPGEWPRVTIGRDSWVGDRAIVLADVGKHCVIGAGSVAKKPLPDYVIAVGLPAKVVRYRTGAPR